jgi:hypothetical protein
MRIDQATVSQENFTRELLEILDETFVTHHGIYLDRNTSLFETLAGIGAEQASIPVGGNCATLAAQVAHVTFFLEVLERYMRGEDADDVDWGEIWRRVGAASAIEWQGYQDQLKATYERVASLLKEWKDWDDGRPIGGALAIVAHSAYHLGEIRQALCTLRG